MYPMKESARRYTTDTISHGDNFLVPFTNATILPNSKIRKEMKLIMENT
jgi:hypothetical protein